MTGPAPLQRWLIYLANERREKLHRIDAFASGYARLSMTTEGVQRDITEESLQRLREDVAEIDRILVEAGIDPNA